MQSPRISRLGSTLILAILASAVAFPSLAEAQDPDLEELKATVRAMQKTINEQNARIASLEKQQGQQKPAKTKTKSIADTSASRPASRPEQSASGTPSSVSVLDIDLEFGDLPANALPEGTAGVRDSNNLQDLQTPAPRANNAPLDPNLKGFIAIPGTDTIVKLGGSARIDGIVDFGNNGNPNLFTPSSIPVPGQAGYNGGERSTLQAKATRLSLELRRPVPFDSNLRIYSEFDFFDDSSSSSMKLRVRHFYGQAWNFLIGQTFSAFMDPDAFPDVVDYQGPNGIVNRRQPQIRYTVPIYDQDDHQFELFASMEQPESQINADAAGFPADSSAVNKIPDWTGGFRWEGPAGYLQGTGLLRDLSYETDSGPTDSVFGWGLSLSGSLNVFKKDKLSLQATYGEGVARYINDLSGTNMDAGLSGGELRAIPVFAAMAGYTHHWSEHWRSTVSGGYVHANPPDSLGSFAIDSTVYSSANLMWHPTTSFRMGLESLYGHKKTSNGAERDAFRLDFVVRYDLVR